MEVVLHVSKEALKEFPEEAPRLEEATTSKEQSGKVSQTQGTVQDLFSLSTSPTSHLLDRIHRGQVSYLPGKSPIPGGSGNRPKLFRYQAGIKRPRKILEATRSLIR